LRDDGDDVCKSLQTVLSVVAVLHLQLSAPSLAALLHFKEVELLGVLRDVHSILDIPDDRQLPIRLQHASVRDFLLDKRRCTDVRFWVDEKQAHGQTAKLCLHFLGENLRKDLCGLNKFGALASDIPQDTIEACVPPVIRYASLHWISHVKRSHSVKVVEKLIKDFMWKYFLQWLEALSLVGQLGDGVEQMFLLESLCVSSSSK
jgi:hypothetical protein